MELDKIYNVDSYEFIKTLPDKCIDLIYTDPPYKIEGLQTGTGILKHRTNLNNYLHQMIETDLVNGIDYDILNEFCRVMKHIYIYIYGVIKNKFMII